MKQKINSYSPIPKLWERLISPSNFEGVPEGRGSLFIISFFSLFIILILPLSTTAQAQCPNFTDLYSPNVTAYTGKTGNPFLTQGVVPGRHTLITEQGTDPNTGNALNFLPAGENKVIKLGNEQVGSEAEALSYRFTVDVDNTMLLLKFAVVLEDPGHVQIAQPRFVVRVTDSEGNLIEACADYDVSSGADIPGFQTYQMNANKTIRWRDWTNVGIDLLGYVGQEVQVQIITYDCSQGAHFGYAYFTASCLSNKLQIGNCSGGTFTLEAPENFESYLWSNGTTERIATFSVSEVINTEISCVLTAATGCQVTLYAYISTTGGVLPGDYTDIICEGETYTKHNFNLPPQQPGQHFYQIVIVDPTACTDEQFINLELTVLERYHHIYAAICHGENYTENGFNIIAPAPGVWRDTLLTGTIPPDCETYNILELTISMSFSMPNIIEGDTSPCTEELVTYSFAGSETLTSFYWEFPDNVVVVKGKYSPQVTVYFTDDTPGNVILKGVNGCGSGTASLQVHPRKTHLIQLNEQICQGKVFNKYNFNLGLQDSVGYFVYGKHLKSSLGCDSVVTLALNVLPTPVVRIEPAEPVICIKGEDITLWALTDTMQYESSAACPGNHPSAFIYDCEIEYLWNTGSTEGFINVNPNITTNYTVTVTLSSGCSASASQFVVVKINEPVVINETICRGETYSAYNITATETGVYQTIIHAEGCDIPVTINLTVIEPKKFLIQQNICAGKNFTGYGFDFTLYQVGLFVDTVHFISSAGCDSLVIFNLNVLPDKTTTVYDTICQYLPYSGYGFTLPKQNFSGLQTYTKESGVTAQGCDSTTILKLLVNPVYLIIISDEDTVGKHYQKYGFDIILTKTGLISDTIKSHTQSGCDSTVILNLNVISIPIEFYANNVHYSVLKDTVFCKKEAFFSAKIEGFDPSKDVLKWYIDGNEETAAYNQLTWSKPFATGDYLIKMEVIFDGGNPETLEGILRIKTLWINIKNVRY